MLFWINMLYVKKYGLFCNEEDFEDIIIWMEGNIKCKTNKHIKTIYEWLCGVNRIIHHYWTMTHKSYCA